LYAAIVEALSLNMMLQLGTAFAYNVALLLKKIPLLMRSLLARLQQALLWCRDLMLGKAQVSSSEAGYFVRAEANS